MSVRTPVSVAVVQAVAIRGKRSMLSGMSAKVPRSRHEVILMDQQCGSMGGRARLPERPGVAVGIDAWLLGGTG